MHIWKDFRCELVVRLRSPGFRRGQYQADQELLPTLLCVCGSLCSQLHQGPVCTCVVHHGCTVPLLKADLPAGRAAASLGLGWRDLLGLGPLLAGHDSQGGGISGLLNLLAPLAPLMSGLQFRWGFEKRAGLEMEGQRKQTVLSKDICRVR